MGAYMEEPVLLGLDANREIRAIDEVPNGMACGCFCPSPACNAPLVAKNRGGRLRHHFAHKPGCGCKWAVESAITLLAKKAIEEAGVFRLPSYFIADWVERLELKTFPAVGVRTMEFDGWGAPLLVVSCQVADEVIDYLFLITWKNEMPKETYKAIKATGMDIVMVSLREMYSNHKYEAERHTDSTDFLRRMQDTWRVSQMVAGHCMEKTWLINARMDRIREDYRQDQRRAIESMYSKTDERKAKAQEAKDKRAQARLAHLEDFCVTNGLTLLEVKGAGRRVECPLDGKSIGVMQTDRGCVVCEGLVRDFGDHIACAAEPGS